MQNDISKSKILIIGLIILVFTLSIFIFRQSGSEGKVGALDSFAQCLTDRDYTMYGAYWCPHCQNEKTAFGDSFRFVNYVECTQEPQQCLAAGIKGYPTWITDDGRRFEGEQGIERLAEASGCAIDGASITQ